MNRDSLFTVSLRATRRAATRDRILAAAHDLVASGGWAAANIVDVARAAGIATGSIYRHFPSKGALCAEVFRIAADREVELMARIADGDGTAAERLARAIEAFCRRALAAPTLTYALMAEPVDPDVEEARLRSKRAHRKVFAALLREGVDNGEFAPLDPPVVASALVGAMQEALADHTGGDALVAQLVSFTLNAVHIKEPVTWPPSRPAARRSPTRS